MIALNTGGIAVSALFVAFILLKRVYTRADFWLVVINLIMIGFLCIVMLASQKFTTTTFFLQSQLPFYLFPAYLLFALERLQNKRSTLWLFLFVPAIAGSACIAADLYFFQNYDSPARLHEVYNDPPFYYHIVYKGNQVFFLAALILLLRKLKAYKRDINNSFSFTDPIDLNWLTNSGRMYVVLILLSLTTFLLSNFKVVPTDAQTSFAVVSGCLSLIIFYLSFHGIRQYSIADYYGKKVSDQFEETSTQRISLVDSVEKYRTSSLTMAEKKTIYHDLLKLFEREPVYKESRLQLSDVADKLHVSPSNLSQTINSMAGMPFSDFVNGHRVKYLQKLLEDPVQRRFTILALGLESGFNSKASLNRVFKEQTGSSPSEYQRRNFQK